MRPLRVVFGELGSWLFATAILLGTWYLAGRSQGSALRAVLYVTPFAVLVVVAPFLGRRLLRRTE